MPKPVNPLQDLYAQLGRVLKYERIGRGIKRKDAAAHLDTHVNCLERFENGRGMISREKIRKLIDMLKVVPMVSLAPLDAIKPGTTPYKHGDKQLYSHKNVLNAIQKSHEQRK
jgi:ribosome-binding protein aMBF1 (putative translation factor)